MSQDYPAQRAAAIAAYRRLRGQPALLQLARLADLAESHGDAECAVDALCQWIQDAHHLDLMAPQVSALQRLLGLYIGNPRYSFARERVLWYHKWVAESLVENADVARATIDQMFQSLDRLFTAEHVGLRPSHMLRCRTAWMMGCNDEAREHFDRWQATPPGKSDDCPACEANARVEFLLALSKFEEAMEAAEPLLRGELFCDEVPAVTFSRLIMIALDVGNPRLAEGMHLSTVRQLRHKVDLLACLARHIVYRSLTGRAQSTRRLAALALAKAPQVSDYNRFAAYLSGTLWFSLLVREGVKTVPLPRQFVLAQKQRDVPTPFGAQWCLEQSRGLAVRFDARNGNRLFATRIQESENLIRAICQD
jgi:hypothetical protein